jgi:acetyl-CoA acyltransferase
VEREAVIVGAVRSPIGKRCGALAGVHPVHLLAHVLRELMERTGCDPEHVDDHITGCVSQVGEQSVNVARNGWLAAGLPETVPSTTVDRQCGSSLQAIHFAVQGVMAGSHDLVVASGVESMSRVPMGSPTGDSDPYGEALSDRYEGKLVPQSISAELVAGRWDVTREEADELGWRSHARAADAMRSGRFDEAFAAMVLAWKKELGVPDAWFEEHVNPNGGAIALGHPLGAAGCRLMATMLHELERRRGRFGLETICEGGGMANAIVLERLG